MKVRAEADDWRPEGRKILSPENLEIIGKTLEDDGPVILEHWHYRGARAPDRHIFDDLEALVDHIQTKSAIGDAFHIWSFATACTDQNILASGKFPDEDGCVPRKGAY
jgi:hypothetical protein